MSIAHRGAGTFQIKFEGHDAFVVNASARPRPDDTEIHWLEGTYGKYTYVVYLLDDTTDSTVKLGDDQIVKHYRVELFDQKCFAEEPVEGKNFRTLSTSTYSTCVDVEYSLELGKRATRETGSGEGYEPKH